MIMDKKLFYNIAEGHFCHVTNSQTYVCQFNKSFIIVPWRNQFIMPPNISCDSHKDCDVRTSDFTTVPLSRLQLLIADCFCVV